VVRMATSVRLVMAHRACKLNQLLAHLIGRLVLHPVPDAIQPNIARQAGKTIAQLRFGQLIDGKEPVRHTPHEVGGLLNPRAAIGGRQIKERLNSAIIVERTMKPRALKLGDVVREIIGLDPTRVREPVLLCGGFALE
jgi:hypothetical protein